MSRFRNLSPVNVREKSSAFDVVTEADEAAEAVLPIPRKPPVCNGMIAPRDSWMMPPPCNGMIPPGAPLLLA